VRVGNKPQCPLQVACTRLTRPDKLTVPYRMQYCVSNDPRPAFGFEDALRLCGHKFALRPLIKKGVSLGAVLTTSHQQTFFESHKRGRGAASLSLAAKTRYSCRRREWDRMQSRAWQPNSSFVTLRWRELASNFSYRGSSRARRDR